MKAVFYGVVAFLLFIAAIFGLAMYSGFAISLLWGWLIMPTFPVAAISVVQGIGLSVFAGYFLRHAAIKELEKNDEESVAEKVVNSVGKSFFTITGIIGVGWIVSLFM